MIGSTFYRLSNGCAMGKLLFFNLSDNLGNKVVVSLNLRFYVLCWQYIQRLKVKTVKVSYSTISLLGKSSKFKTCVEYIMARVVCESVFLFVFFMLKEVLRKY